MGREKRRRKGAQGGLSQEVVFELNSEQWAKGSRLRSEKRVLKAGEQQRQSLGAGADLALWTKRS